VRLCWVLCCVLCCCVVDVCDGFREGFTPIHFAASNVQTLAQVLQARSPQPNVNSLTTGGIAPIHCAASASVDCVRLLLQHQASVGVVDKLGQNPLHYAALDGKGDCIYVLVQAMGVTTGAFINQKEHMVLLFLFFRFLSFFFFFSSSSSSSPLCLLSSSPLLSSPLFPSLSFDYPCTGGQHPVALGRAEWPAGCGGKDQ